MTYEKSLQNLAQKDLESLAARLAEATRREDVIALHGNLGAGKTTFSRAFIQHLNPNEKEIPSPTFGLVNRYDSATFPIWHYDLYRLKHPGEIIELGFDEALTSGIALIEWPDIAESLLPDNRLDVYIEEAGNTLLRHVRFTCNNHWKERIDDLLRRQ